MLLKRLSKPLAAALAAALTLGTATAQGFNPRAPQRYSDIEAEMNSLAAVSSTANVFTYGQSYQGRRLNALSVGPTGSTGSLGVIVCIGANIPREWAGVVLIQDLMEEIAVGTNPAFNVVRSSYQMIFIPVMNPDGYEWTWTNDRLWQKSRTVWPPSACQGVNLDRNWPPCFGGADSSLSPCSENHCGTVLGEVETQRLSNLLASFTNLAAVLDFRAYPYELPAGIGNAGAVLWPYGDVCGRADPCLSPIAAAMAKSTYFQGPVSASAFGPAGGIMIDWCHDALSVPAFQVYPEIQAGWTYADVCLNNQQLLPGLAAGLANVCSRPCGQWAGDFDNFAIAGQPADTLFQRQLFRDWLRRPGGSNALYHNGQSLPFDTAATDWWCAYTFSNVRAAATSGRVTLRLRGSNSGCGNDALYLRFDGTTVTWGGYLRDLELLAGGDGVWSSGETMTLTLDLTALPGVSTVNLMPQIAADGFLDVYIQDDTDVDFLELSLCDYPAVGGSCLGAPCPTCPAMRLATTGTPLHCSTQFGPQSRFALELTGAPSGGAALFLLNVGPCTAGLPWACGSVLPNPIGWLAIPSAPLGGTGACGGSARLPLGLPCGTQGFTLCAQVAIACPTGGFGLSNGIEFTIE